MTTQIIQARVTEEILEQLLADAATLGIENTSSALRFAIDLLHHEASQMRLSQSYGEFYQGEPAPLSEVTAALWGSAE